MYEENYGWKEVNENNKVICPYCGADYMSHKKYDSILSEYGHEEIVECRCFNEQCNGVFDVEIEVNIIEDRYYEVRARKEELNKTINRIIDVPGQMFLWKEESTPKTI